MKVVVIQVYIDNRKLTPEVVTSLKSAVEAVLARI